MVRSTGFKVVSARGSNSGDLAKGFHFSESQEAHRVSISLGVGEDWCPRGNPSLLMGLSFLIFKMGWCLSCRPLRLSSRNKASGVCEGVPAGEGPAAHGCQS